MFHRMRQMKCIELTMVLAAVAFAYTAGAEDYDAQKTAMKTGKKGVNLACGQKLIGTDVMNNEGDKIGAVKDIVLNSTHDRIEYVAIDHGGLAGIGAKSFAIPWSEFNLTTKHKDAGETSAEAKRDKEYRLTLNVAKDSFDNLEGFDEANWPRQASRSWQQNQRAEPQPAESSEVAQRDFDARRLSNLLGSEVRSGDAMAASRAEDQSVEAMGEKIGELNDAIVNAESGQIAYAFVKLDDNAVTGEQKGNMSTVPWSALTIHESPKVHAMFPAANRTNLASYTFTEDQAAEQLGRLAERDYSRQIYTAYNQEPQWEALGFVGTELDMQDRMEHEKQTQTQTQPGNRTQQQQNQTEQQRNQ